MSNVIILGAGCSVDAGIPLLSNFVSVMWEIALRGKYKNRILDEDEIKIFKNAISVRKELDSYHGRANFNDLNIEDILSILVFNTIEGKPIETKRLNWIIKAIEKTIDITCEVKHDGRFEIIQDEGSNIYLQFWKSLFAWYKEDGKFPTIITFNYDLVLERSLFQILNSSAYKYKEDLPFRSVKIDYHYQLVKPQTYSIKNVYYPGRRNRHQATEGIALENVVRSLDDCYNINILKLHGSVNFPRRKGKTNEIISLVENVDNPFIIPPVSNKTIDNHNSNIWREALNALRNAINVSIVGYSMPITDTYLQYFLKAAIGPNLNLNKIFIFNPAFEQNDEEMEKRYFNCFSTQLRERIIINPNYGATGFGPGTFGHFVVNLSRKESDILF